MPAKINFKKTMLHLSMSQMTLRHNNNKRLCLSMFLMLMAQQAMAEIPTETPVAHATQTEMIAELKSEAVKQGMDSAEEIAKIDHSMTAETSLDSMQMLQEQQNAQTEIDAFKPIAFDDLEQLPIEPVDQQMANEIMQAAEQAKQEAQDYRASQKTEMTVPDISVEDLQEINKAPVNIDDLMQSIRADSEIAVAQNEDGKTLNAPVDESRDQSEEVAKHNIFKRLLYKVRPPRQINTAKVARISAEVVIENAQNDGRASQKNYDQALLDLKENIKGKLSSFTQESFSDFSSALPQLRSLSSQAAQAVGFYNAEFKFEKLSESKVKVLVQPNSPVILQEHHVEFSGAGENQAQFQVIGVLPDQDVGDIFHHGKYENTKLRINDAASNNGYFDSYWRLHDVKVAQPQDTAEVNLRFETGERYKLGNVEFRMSDPEKAFPLNKEILQSLVPWKDGADYAFWRVNGLANNLTNSRYFNYTLVDAVRPDPIEKQLELPPDIQKLVDQNKVAAESLEPKGQQAASADQEVSQHVVNEDQFAGVTAAGQNERMRTLQAAQDDKQVEQEKLKAQARDTKVVPVIVTLNADKLNSAEIGAGFGTDTGPRLRGQYRRAIVNERGHSFDANLELSNIRQSLDARYNIPYKHPLNDYISLVGGYEREERDNVGADVNLMIESAVAGADRIIKNPRGSWQHTYGVRYRLDRITDSGLNSANIDEIPDAFLVNANSEQESLLLGYEISRTDSDKRVNPSKGFKQTYKIEFGSESLLSDADMAIVNAGWRFIYSLGENDNHQFVGRSDLGYIFTEDFDKVPYNLRYFTGGDQTIRGFDYKSLAAEEDGYKIGGQALAVGSLEYNYQFKEGWRAAVFTDFGNAYDKDFNTETEYGAGLGIRWASPIGPIRIDVAAGLSDENTPIRLHFFIGSQL
ncbi:autotransporter assembly complex protein TamA [Acinetobacter tianfuensis]|uniref:Outer membrane protein assembly factor n=1 Tax=Acinetobacter tianfuensis TaxID=2419603 RepID=A0A3A8EIJ5_9GAMM|nr:BamA/TamA family outer membrane protein [Acinetobacter tianfuensis]RKG33999.1 outer membrane protein assembly factor [Acinetobacter tianfuensis]